MVVLHVIVGLGKGGAENTLSKLVCSMQQHRHIVVSLTTIGCTGRKLRASGHTVLALNIQRSNCWLAPFLLWKLYRKYHPDVLQTWMYHSDLLGGVVGRLAGIRTVVWNIRGTQIPQNQWSSTGVVVKICALLSHFVPHTIVCCANAAFETHVKLGYRRNRLVVIPNGYDGDEWPIPSQEKEVSRRRLRLPVSPIVIGFVGRFDRLKGCDVFIEAAGLVTETLADKCMFVMVGRNCDTSNKELAAMICEKGGRAEIKLLGERDDVAEVMHSLDVFCLSSRAEGFPNVVAEAMLMQVPCAVTNAGDAGAIVGSTGRVVPPNNPRLMADAILELSDLGAEKRMALGREGRKKVLEQFALRDIVNRYIEIYEGNRTR